VSLYGALSAGGVFLAIVGAVITIAMRYGRGKEKQRVATEAAENSAEVTEAAVRGPRGKRSVLERLRGGPGL